MKKAIVSSLIFALSAALWPPAVQAGSNYSHAGKFFIQAEANGELWYIMPDTGERFFIKGPKEAIDLVKLTGIGISNRHLSHIPDAEGIGRGPFDNNLAKRLAGKFLLQVEENGEAWYVNPQDMKRYYLGRPDQAFALFSSIAAGISNEAAGRITEAKSIVDVAVEAGSFSTLAAAVQAAGLAETLDQGGPFTVFAPTDEAFAKLPEGTVESLLNDIPALTDILLYHVVSGRVMSSGAAKLSQAPTLQGSSISIKAMDGYLMVDQAKVISPDIKAVNGVIHVIDSVILP